MPPIKYVGNVFASPRMSNTGGPPVSFTGRIENRTDADHSFDIEMKVFEINSGCLPDGEVVLAESGVVVPANSSRDFVANYSPQCASLDWQVNFTIAHLGTYQAGFEVYEA